MNGTLFRSEYFKIARQATVPTTSYQSTAGNNIENQGSFKNSSSEKDEELSSKSIFTSRLLRRRIKNDKGTVKDRTSQFYCNYEISTEKPSLLWFPVLPPFSR